jgi:phage shock protein PspC (stress-responsive transcriptional regulator)
MQRVITIHLDGEPNPYRLDEDAHDALSRYLDQARSRLTDDSDRAEVMGDLERSIGAKLTDRLGSNDRILTIEDIDAVLAAVGPVGSGDDRPATVGADRPRGRRRLLRIRAGQQLAGVCTGLAAYTEIRVDWVRTIFLLLAVFTAGLFALVYLAMAFALPVVPTREAWIAAQDQD